MSLGALDERNSTVDASQEVAVAVTQTPVAIGIKWTVGKVFWTLGVFILAGLAEIGGGWLVWQTIRNKKPWYYFVGGILSYYMGFSTAQDAGTEHETMQRGRRRHLI